MFSLQWWPQGTLHQNPDQLSDKLLSTRQLVMVGRKALVKGAGTMHRYWSSILGDQNYLFLNCLVVVFKSFHTHGLLPSKLLATSTTFYQPKQSTLLHCIPFSNQFLPAITSKHILPLKEYTFSLVTSLSMCDYGLASRNLEQSQAQRGQPTAVTSWGWGLIEDWKKEHFLT